MLLRLAKSDLLRLSENKSSSDIKQKWTKKEICHEKTTLNKIFKIYYKY